MSEKPIFGQGSVVGSMYDSSFMEADIRDQARHVGYAAGCPVVNELTDPNNSPPGRGPEAMLGRYGEVSLWYRFIERTTDVINPELYEQLTSPIARLPEEPVGKYEQESVPLSHLRQMSQISTIEGYALPRIFIEQLGTHADIPKDQVQARLVRGLSILEDAIVEARTPAELLSILGEDLVTYGDTSPKLMLKHILSAGWLEEHNAKTMIKELKNTMQELAPTLWAFYDNLSPEDIQELQLA